MFESIYTQQRLEKVQKIAELGHNPYNNQSKRDTTIKDFLEINRCVCELEDGRDTTKDFCIAGRIKFFRAMGKASFIKIEDENGVLQIYIAKDHLPQNIYETIFKLSDVGDIVEVNGYPFVTKQGELSLHAKNFTILTKSLTPLPEKFHGVTDKEIRYRQRYLDLIMDSDVRKVFQTRSKVITLIRRFFEDKGFLEVETPMMHPIAGGANAKPFITHHNALGVDRYLRIAPELYLKRLIVGGFEAVFEINRCFRNEGMDATHNPEFTSIEFYWAYKTYRDLIKLTIELFDFIFCSLELPKVLPYGEHMIDFNNFVQISYLESLVTIGGVDPAIIDNKTEIITLLKQNNIEATPKETLGNLQAKLFDNFVEAKLINPTFITDFPIDISPLARRNDNAPHLADRFELFIAGKEIANAFSELNDPVDQYARFNQQVQAKVSGDDEAHAMDEDFIEALKYAMAPTAGQGIGIDRLVMMLTNSHSIRDVLLFPAMKPLANKTEES